MSEASKYRQWADECQLTAKRAVRREDEAFWLRWAEDWMKLAEQREKIGPTAAIEGEPVLGTSAAFRRHGT